MSAITFITLTPLVDLWSVIHFCFWAFLSSSISALWEPPLWIHVLYTVVASYIWEGIEFPLQRRIPELWSYRLESVWNSFITDPLFNILGSLFGWFVVAYYRKHWWIWRKQLGPK